MLPSFVAKPTIFQRNRVSLLNVPEPTSVIGLALFGGSVLLLRRRQQDAN
ncbi:PEP-CTERM sorting domain-containing protein [Microseira wollei]